MQEDEKAQVLNALKALRDDKELKEIENCLQGVDAEIVEVINDLICQRNIHNENKNVANKLNAELKEISNVINGIANGDLSQQVFSNMKGEMGDLKDIVNNLNSMLNSYVSETNNLMHEMLEGKYGGETEVQVNGIWKEGVGTLNAISKNFTEHVQRVVSEKMATQNYFLGNMSSELRTPLNAILGLSDVILSENPLMEEVIEYITMIKRAGMIILNDVLDLQRLMQEREAYGLFTIRSIIQETLIHFSEQFAGKIVNVDIEKDVPDALIGDPKKILQVLRHLLSKTNNENEVLISIAQKNRSANKIILCITIDANGLSFTHLRRAEIFHACRLVVELLHGELIYQDEPKGCVTLEVPVEIDKNKLFESSQQIPTYLDDVTPRTILVVSPHEVSRNVLMRMVLTLELTPELAQNANEAKAKLISAGNKGFLMALVDESCACNDLSKVSIDNNVKEVIMCNRMNTTRSESILVKPVLQHDLLKAVQDALRVKYSVTENSNYWSSSVANFKIMIAEDNILNQTVMEKLIKNKLRFNGTLVIVSNGQEAVDKFKEDKFDLIFMDIEMPVKGGFEATMDIRNLEGPERRTTIIGLTSKLQQSDFNSFHAAGMDECISKPIRSDVLQQKLEKYISEKNLKEQ